MISWPPLDTTPLLIAAILLAFTLGFAAALRIHRWTQQRRGDRNRKVGRRAEKNALTLLKAEGFTLVDPKPRLTHTLWIDGDPETFSITPDYIVQRDGQHYVVEVKRYKDHGGINNAGIRRQVTEYLVAANLPCLLVTMPEGQIQLVELPDEQ